DTPREHAAGTSVSASARGAVERAGCRSAWSAWRSAPRVRAHPRGERRQSRVHCSPFRPDDPLVTANQDQTRASAASLAETPAPSPLLSATPSATLIVSLVLATALGPLAMSSFI